MFQKKQAGFTYVELISVIVLLGILGVVVAPKFIGIKNDAYKASVNGFYGGFKSAVNMVHQVWEANGRPTQLTLKDGTVIDMNSAGYPTVSGGGNLACIDLASHILSTTPELKEWNAAGGDSSAGYYVLGVGGGFAYCVYVIRGPMTEGVFRYFSYLPSTGQVSIINS